jgi:predicted O-methyltransferase YrrM
MKTIKEIKEEIAQNWVEKHFSTPQRDFLINILRELKPSYCLETGFCTGSSSATISATCLPTKLISVGLAYNNMEVAKKLEEQYAFSLIQGDSTSILTSEFFEKEYPEGIDFFHVDGGHDYNAAFSDLENAFPYMNEGAIILVDDYHSKMCPLESVDRAVDDFVAKNNLSMEKVNTEDGKGMAVIRL